MLNDDTLNLNVLWHNHTSCAISLHDPLPALGSRLKTTLSIWSKFLTGLETLQAVKLCCCMLRVQVCRGLRLALMPLQMTAVCCPTQG